MEQRTRPRSVTIASYALIAWVVVLAVFNVVTGGGLVYWAGAALGIALWTWLATFLLKGANAARIVYACLWPLNVAYAVYLVILGTGPAEALPGLFLGLAGLVVHFAALGGLTKSEASLFFTGRPAPFLDYLVNSLLTRSALVFGVLAFGVLAVSNWVMRWDLTEDQRFSISPASHRIASSLPDPLTVRAYFSGRIPEWIVPMQRQVFDILAEYEAHSNGKIKVERYDPLESMSARSEAESYGVQQFQIPIQEATGVSVQQVYGSIVLIYGDRAPQVINIADRYREGYDGLSVLESELSGKIYDLSHERTKIGITGYLEREARGNPMMGMQQPRPEFNELRSRLGGNFEIEDVDLDRAEPDPKEVPLLLVVRPKEMSDVAVFRLDQYLMKGGRVLCFITEGVIDRQPWPPRQFTYEPFKTGLEGWLEHNGLRVPNEFVCHLVNANEIPVERVMRTPMGDLPVRVGVPNWFWPMFGVEGSIDRDNPAVQQLKSVDLFWPHPVDILENRLDGHHATVLVRSHAEESWRWKALQRIDMSVLSPEKDGPSRADLMSSAVAVALDGEFTSYFADRPVPPSLQSKAPEGKGPGEGEGGEPPGGNGEEGPGGDEKPAGDGEPAGGEAPAPAGPEVVRKSVVPTQLVVVGNAVFVSDMALGGGGERAEITASLGLNLVNWLSGSSELIALRAKRYTNRALKDEQVQEDLKAWRKQVEAGEMEEETFRQRIDEVREMQKGREKRARWINVVVPIFLIWLLGAVIWVVRAANRGGTASLPPPEPPQSLAQGGTDA